MKAIVLSGGHIELSPESGAEGFALFQMIERGVRVAAVDLRADPLRLEALRLDAVQLAAREAATDEGGRRTA